MRISLQQPKQNIYLILHEIFRTDRCHSQKPNSNIFSISSDERGVKMAEKSIPEQIIDDFLEKITQKKILDKEKIADLKDVLSSEQPKKADILKAIKEDHKNENT